MVQLLLSLMIVIGVIGARACPNMCKCKNYPRDIKQKNTLYYTSVICSSYVGNISRVLDNTTKDLEVRNLEADELLDMLTEIFENEVELPYFSNLIIRNSDMGNINSIIAALEQVRSLTLIDNNLEQVSELFLNLTDLQSVDLSHNAIKLIEHKPFQALRTLEVLNISANALTQINRDSFVGLGALKCLDVSRNNITLLDDEVFSPLSSLQYLNLSNNRMEALNELCFSNLIMLQQLDVSWNRLARVAPGSLELPSLARLLLAGNPQLGRSREVLVSTGRKLQTVDASRTGLKQVPAALTHSIRTLRLAGNSIRSVMCGDLDSYPLLQLLDFTANDLESIEEDALGRLDSLSILYLTDNKIRDIPKSLPEKLKVLHLEHNEIEIVSDKDLQGLTVLEVLLLNDNKIRVVGEAAFSQLVALVTLDLSGNPVTVLRPGCLTGPTALQVLRLASIGIISPAEEVSFPLSTPEHLITLDLSNSPGLARQLLADTAALAASRELQELDLSRTDLEFIRSDLLHYLPQLRLLHITDNHLNCSQLQWLASWLRRQDDPEYRNIFCSSPADLWGTPLVDLQDVEASLATTTNHQINSLAHTFVPTSNTTDIPANISGQYATQSTNFIGTTQYTKTKQEKNTNNKVENEVLQRLAAVPSTNSAYDSPKTLLGLNNDAIPSVPQQITSPFTSTVPYSSRQIINKTARVAISETTTPLIQTADEQRKLELASSIVAATRDANKTGDARSIKPDHGRLISEISRNLFISSRKKSVNNIVNATEKLSDAEVGIDIAQQWNVTTGEMSMYTNNKQAEGFLVHPGMLILGAGVLGTLAALTMLAARCTKKRRSPASHFRQDDIEVTNLPSVTELW